MSGTVPILTMGDARLRRVARPVVAESLPDDLRSGSEVVRSFDAFRSQFGWGRALAAPQLGIAVRMVAFDLGAGPFLALNPKIVWRSEEKTLVLDDCMCLPQIAAPVERHVSVSVAYLDETMQPRLLRQLPLDKAELFQHEIDHLDGILFVDRIADPGGV